MDVKRDLIKCKFIVDSMNDFTNGRAKFMRTKDCPTGPLMKIVNLTENASEDLSHAMDICDHVFTTIKKYRIMSYAIYCQ